RPRPPAATRSSPGRRRSRSVVYLGDDVQARTADAPKACLWPDARAAQAARRHRGRLRRPQQGALAPGRGSARGHAGPGRAASERSQALGGRRRGRDFRRTHLGKEKARLRSRASRVRTVGASYLILPSRNSTCLRTTGSYFLTTIFSVMVRAFFLV